ncbi:MAG: nitrilase-related carbon-nitrogen hydrolase, partial [Paracoccus sp. (in: a-proteobacteria)]|nr:nitrilase-related carbon-nitrogen hydrolase [Paracoccus sp. (in: a-proteobacteria)]
MTVGLVQLTVGDDPAENLPRTITLIRKAAAGGADWVLTPESTNILSSDRAHQRRVLHQEADDPTLTALRAEAQSLGIWLLVGSLALIDDGPDRQDGRFVNRSLLVAPDGRIAARYDKLHMFDVAISATEQFRE